MIRLLVISVLIFISPFALYTQTGTYGELISIENSPINIGVKLLPYHENILVSSINRCNSNNVEKSCMGISHLTIDGTLISTDPVDFHKPRLGSTAIIGDSTIIMLTQDIRSDSDNIPLTIANLNNFNSTTYELSKDTNKRFFPEGIQKLNDTYIVHGHYDDLTPGVRIKGFVNRYNSDFSKELSSWTYDENESLTLSDLRINFDKELIFSIEEGRVGPNQPEYPIRVVKMDTTGAILKEFNVPDASQSAMGNTNLDMDANGDLYFSYYDGRPCYIAKLDAEMDTLLWNIKLPTSYDLGDRDYIVTELIIAQNGDLLATGYVSYIHQGKDRVISAFVSRIDPMSGSLRWLKFLTHEVTELNAWEESYGETYLYDMIALPDGNIVGVGELAEFTLNNGIKKQIFLLSISADGCIEGFDCDKDIYVLNAGESVDIFTSTRDLLPLDDISIHPNPVQDILYLKTTGHKLNYQILNLQGQEVMQGQYHNSIGVSELPPGIYFLQLQREGELYKAIKFVKE